MNEPKSDTNTKLFRIGSKKNSGIDTDIVERTSKKIEDETKNPKLAKEISRILTKLKEAKETDYDEYLHTEDNIYKTEIRWVSGEGLKIVIRDRTDEMQRLEDEMEREQELIMVLDKYEFLLKNAGELFHEIRNAQTAIIGGLQLLVDSHEFNDHEREMISRMINESYRTSKLSNSYMRVNKNTDKKLRNVILRTSLDTVIDLMEVSYKKDEVKIIRAYKDSEIKILGNTELLHQLWINLLKNSYEAIKATGHPGAIIVSTEPYESRKVKITIHDNGCGMDAEKLRAWKTPNAKLESDKEDGFGRGMNIVKRIIAHHKGAYQVESKPSDTMFSIYFHRA
ncbi:hypothetical protein KY312_00225 [Candidatus Woesearchaeota archaeon]|nr:hypothetical protein [Candidatus Woesearchaeota archaeon]